MILLCVDGHWLGKSTAHNTTDEPYHNCVLLRLCVSIWEVACLPPTKWGSALWGEALWLLSYSLSTTHILLIDQLCQLCLFLFWTCSAWMGGCRHCPRESTRSVTLHAAPLLTWNCFRLWLKCHWYICEQTGDVTFIKLWQVCGLLQSQLKQDCS